MPGEEDWIMRPVMARMCLYESLKDGTLDLIDIGRMNDALDVREDNERLAAKLRERK
jgi:hypothetical protein